MLVSHDLAVIRMLADRTIVMLDGKIIEQGLTDQILDDPQQPYTQQLYIRCCRKTTGHTDPGKARGRWLFRRN